MGKFVQLAIFIYGGSQVVPIKTATILVVTVLLVFPIRKGIAVSSVSLLNQPD